MDESERSRLAREQRALLLGCSDMRQTAAAARALEHEEDIELTRALETAIAVCFMRPFKSTLRVPRDFFPPDDDHGLDARLFRLFQLLRHKTYAHTDKELSGRVVFPMQIEVGPEVTNVNWNEGWNPIPREILLNVIDLCERLGEQMLMRAAAIQEALEMGMQGD